MPRYYFHVDDGVHLPDHEGLILPDLRCAQAEAVKAAGSMLMHQGKHLFEDAGSWQMNVTDGDKRLLFTLRFCADQPSGPITFDPHSNED